MAFLDHVFMNQPISCAQAARQHFHLSVWEPCQAVSGLATMRDRDAAVQLVPHTPEEGDKVLPPPRCSPWSPAVQQIRAPVTTVQTMANTNPKQPGMA